VHTVRPQNFNSSPRARVRGSNFFLIVFNVLIIFEEIQKKLDIEQPKGTPLSEGKLEQAMLIKVLLEGKDDPALQKGILALLERYLPWTPLVFNKLRQQSKPDTNLEVAFGKELLKMLKRLGEERNVQTHYYHEPPDYPAVDLLTIWQRAQKVVAENEHNKVEGALMESIQPDFYTAAPAFSRDGRLFFTCLFLERSDALYFINLFDDYKVKNQEAIDVPNRAKILALSSYCARLPQPKLQSGALHLDMLGELMRVPHEIFRNLSEERQESFVTYDDLTFDEGQRQIVQQRTVMKRHDDRFPYFALRWLEEIDAFESLRFHIHIGKYLKESYDKQINASVKERHIYEPIRTFGKLQDFDTEPESWQHGEVTVPFEEIEQYAPKYQITGNRIGFRFTEQGFLEQGRRLHNAHAAQPDAILSTYELPNLCLYYLLYEQHREAIDKENNIRKGKNISQRKHGKPEFPLILSPEEYLYDFLLRMHQLYEDVNAGAIPRFDTKAEQDDTLFKKDMTPEEREKVFDARRAIYQEQLAPYGLKLHYLTDDLRRYLLKATPTQRLKDGVIRKLQDKIRETSNLLKGMDRFEERDAALRHQLLSEQLRACGLPLVGELATWLARDFTYFKPLDDKGKGKPNNQQYNTLQSMLALYNPYKKEMFIAYLEELELIGKDNAYAHPFLFKLKSKIKECDYVTDLYKEYLVLRINWLRDKLKAVEKTSNNRVITKEVGDFINLKPYHSGSVKHKALRYKEKPILLPRGLFKDAIKDILALETNDAIAEKDNIVRLLGKRMDNLAPAYYAYERRCESRDEHIPTQHIKNGDDLQKLLLVRKQLLSELPESLSNEAYNKLSDKEKEQHQEEQKANKAEVDKLRATLRFYKAIANNEKNIRYIRHTDRVLWLMIKKLAEYKDNVGKAYDLEMANLRHIGFDEQQDMNKKPQLSIELHDRKVTAQLHFRQYGLFRRFMKDRRLENLFAYFPVEDDIVLQVLREELRMYDVERKRLMDQILELEASLWEKHGDELEQKIDKGHLNHSKQLNFIQEYYGEVADFDLVRNIRNAFNHNDVHPLSVSLKRPLLAERADFSAPNEQEQHKIKPAIASYLVDLAVAEYERMKNYL